jgi:hypothetical protein
VAKPRSELAPGEIGPFGCTPCEEDQEEFALSNGLKFKACSKIGGPLREALDAALARGQRIESVLGYRAQRSKGAPDRRGDRTELSNHAFGTAVDVNEEHNGLYENCLRWSGKCRLRKGGPYRPGADPLSLSRESPVVEQLRRAGFSWGGLIEGRQKDFMHFSPSGY